STVHTRGRHRTALPRRTFAERLLTLAAAVATLSLVHFMLAVTHGVSLGMVRTGTIAPALPAGSLAVAQVEPAAAVEIGGYDTVERPGRLPVTHRVVAVEDTEPVALTLQGDANPAPDAEPYRVETVRRVLWSAPGLGRVVARLQHPYA